MQDLSEEISNENSPIWDQDFKYKPPSFLMNQSNKTLPSSPNSTNKKQQNLVNNSIQKSPSSKKKDTDKKQLTSTISNEKRQLELDEENQSNKRARTVQGM